MVSDIDDAALRRTLGWMLDEVDFALRVAVLGGDIHGCETEVVRRVVCEHMSIAGARNAVLSRLAHGGRQ